MPTAARKKKSAARKGGRPKPAARARPRRKGKAPARKPAPKPSSKARATARPAPARPVAPAPPAAAKAAAGKGAVKSAPAAAPPSAPPRAAPKKSARKSALQRRPGFVPGDLLLPTGPQTPEELVYFFRGCAAAAHPALDGGVDEALAKRGQTESAEARAELASLAQATATRFEAGNIDGQLPNRPLRRPIFAGVIERAKSRRREIGAFLRGLDLGRTEASHMDSHGEASMQSLMEWAARLENLAEADEPEQADYAQFHRGLDQLDNTTEALMVDVELTLRRMRDRVR